MLLKPMTILKTPVREAYPNHPGACITKGRISPLKPEDREALEKIQHLFLIKILSKWEIEGNFLNLVSDIYEKHITQIITNFLPKIRNMMTAQHEREIHYLDNINDIVNDPREL